MTTSLTSNVIGPIVPVSPLDTYPTHLDIYGQGGYRVVDNILDRDSIPLDRQKVGMLVRVNENQREYRLTTTGISLADNSWVESSATMDYILDCDVEGLGLSIDYPYIAGTHGESRLILRSEGGSSSPWYIKLPNSVEGNFIDDQIYQIDTSLKLEPCYVFIDPREDVSFLRASTRYLTNREVGISEDDNSSPYMGYAMNSQIHYIFESYPSTKQWVPVGNNALLIQDGNNEFDGYWGNNAEKNSQGKLTRYTLSEEQYTELTENRVYFLDPRTTSEETPYIACFHGEDQVILRYPYGTPNSEHVTAFLVLPNIGCHAVWEGVSASEVAETLLHSDADLYLDTSTNSPPDINDVKQPSCIIMSDRITNMQSHLWDYEGGGDGTSGSGLYPTRPDCCLQGFILGTRTHVQFEFYRQNDIDSWTVAGGNLATLLETIDNVDGWGHPALLNDHGALKRYTLTQDQYNKLGDTSAGIIYITYNNLKDKKDGTNLYGNNPERGGLLVGQRYTITDYFTKYLQPSSNTLKIGIYDGVGISEIDLLSSIEPITITASSTNTFHGIGSSTIYGSDVIYYDFDSDTVPTIISQTGIEDIYNTKSAFSWNGQVYTSIGDQLTPSTSYQMEPLDGPFFRVVCATTDLSRNGCITRRVDEFRNISAHYDWRVVKVARYLPNDTTYYFNGVTGTITEISPSDPVVRGNVYTKGPFISIGIYDSVTGTSYHDNTTMDISYRNGSYYSTLTPIIINNNVSSITSNISVYIPPNIQNKQESFTFGNKDSDDCVNISISPKITTNIDVNDIPDVWFGTINNTNIKGVCDNISLLSCISCDINNFSGILGSSYFNITNNGTISSTFYPLGNMIGVRGDNVNITDNLVNLSDVDIESGLQGVICFGGILSTKINQGMYNSLSLSSIYNVTLNGSMSDTTLQGGMESCTLSTNYNGASIYGTMSDVFEVGDGSIIPEGTLETSIIGSNNSITTDRVNIFGNNNDVNSNRSNIIGSNNYMTGNINNIYGSNVSVGGYGVTVIGGLESTITASNRCLVGSITSGYGLLPVFGLDAKYVDDYDDPQMEFGNDILKVSDITYQVGDNYMTMPSRFGLVYRIGDYCAYLEIGSQILVYKRVVGITNDINNEVATLTFDSTISVGIDPAQNFINILPTPISIHNTSDLSSSDQQGSIPIKYMDPLTNDWNNSYRITSEMINGDILPIDNIVENDSITIVNLPSAIGLKGKKIVILNTYISTCDIIPVTGETISGQLGISLSQYESVTVYSNGTNWFGVKGGIL